MPDHHPPVGEQPGKKAQVAQMFDAIAGRYDMLNHVLSFGIDRYWRRQAIDELREVRPLRVLDVATGTGDLAIGASNVIPATVVGVDISEEMLQVGREKVRRKGLEEKITLQYGDSEALPFKDGAFGAVTVAFGVRNFEDLQRGLSEIRRVLKPGGKVVILEFSHPRAFPIKQFYSFYSRHVLPRVGAAVSGDTGAYRYLPESVAEFPDGDDFLERLHRAGFTDCEWRPLTFGIASLYSGRRR